MCQISEDLLKVMVEWPVSGGARFLVICGAAMSFVLVQVYNKSLHHIPLDPPPPIQLKYVTGGRVTVIGRATTACVILGVHKCQNLKLIVMSNEVAASLLGIDWLRVLCPQSKSVLKGLIGVFTY